MLFVYVNLAIINTILNTNLPSIETQLIDKGNIYTSDNSLCLPLFLTSIDICITLTPI